MKKTREIIGLPIINITDGIEMGKVKNIIVNAAKGAIEYLIVDSGIQFLSAKIVPTSNILGIGEYAVTIENEEALIYLNEIPAAIELLQKDIRVIGTKLLTKKGRLIGEVGDFYVDEDNNCNILGLEYVHENRNKIIPRTSIISISKNFIVVIEEVESSLLDIPEEIITGDSLSQNNENTVVEDIGGRKGTVYNTAIIKDEPNADEDKSLIDENNPLGEDNSLFEEIDSSYPGLKLEPDLFLGDMELDFSMFQENEVNKEDYFGDEINIDEININLENDIEPDIETDIGLNIEPDIEHDFEPIDSDELSFMNLEEDFVFNNDNNDIQEIPENDDINLDVLGDLNKLGNLDDKESVPENPFADSDKSDLTGDSLLQSSAANLFEQRQKEYLTGRKVTKTITTSSGTVIVSQGDTITDEVIELSKRNGKLIELIMNNEA